MAHWPGRRRRTVTISILLADDQPMLRLGFRLVLDAQDDMHVVGEAGDGAAALRLAQAERPDVVLMDVRMPGMDGIEATRRIVASAQHDPGADPHHLRPRRVRLRRAAGRRERLPAQGRPAHRPAVRDPRGRQRRRRRRARRHPAAARRVPAAPARPRPRPRGGAAARAAGADRAGTRDPHRRSPPACPTPRSPSGSSWPRPR